MQITLTIRRSDKWVAARRLERGENVPQDLELTDEVSSLSAEAREILLAAGGGSYQVKPDFSFDTAYKLNRYSGYGHEYLLIDADTASSDELSAAIVAVNNRLAVRRAEYEVAQQEREAREAQQRAEREERDRKLAEARALLANELRELEQFKEDRRVLAEFLAAIPGDAQRGTLKALVSGPDQIAALKKKIEDAAPIWVFHDEDGEESDD